MGEREEGRSKVEKVEENQKGEISDKKEEKPIAFSKEKGQKNIMEEKEQIFDLARICQH